MKAERRSLHDVLTGHARDRSGSLAVREPEREWSYGDLRSTSVEIEGALASAGLGHGARAALVLPNSGAFVVMLMAPAAASGPLLQQPGSRAEMHDVLPAPLGP